MDNVPESKQTDGGGQKSSQGWGSKQENSLDKSEIPCRFKFCKIPSCKFWHPPVCLNYKSEKGCKHGDKCHFRHVEADGKPNKKSKKGGAKGSSAILKEFIHLGCVSQDSSPRKSILREPGMLGSKHAVKFSKGAWHQIKLRDRKGPSRGIIPKRAPHERSPCPPKIPGKITRGNLAPRKMRPQSSVGLGEKTFTSPRIRTQLRYIFLVKQR